MADQNGPATKKAVILVATPSYGYMKTKYVTSLFGMWDRFYRNPLPEGYSKDPRDRSLMFGVIEGSVVAQSREDLSQHVVKHPEITHILFIDEDMGFRSEVLPILLSRNVPIVGCNYRIKVPPCPFTARTADGKSDLKTTAESTGLEETLWMGLGFCLIERQVLENTEVPRYFGGYNTKMRKYATEDAPFFLNARKAGYVPYVDQDASKMIYHCGNWSYSWDDDFPAEKRYPIAERTRYYDE